MQSWILHTCDACARLRSLSGAIVNREEGLEGRQTSKAFALIGFRC